MITAKENCAVPSEATKPVDIEEETKALKNVLKSYDTTEKQLDCLIRKYVELANQNKMSESKCEVVTKKNEQICEERDHLQASYNRANLAKSKLESLCRELQRHVKSLKEEYDAREKEEDTKRQEIANRFQLTINDINSKMGDNQKANQSLRDDNLELAAKLKGLLEQYKLREEHVEKILKHKSLEVQLCEAKLAQQVMQGAEEKEKELTEKRNLLEDYLQEKKKNELLIEQEQELRNQLSLYTEKFEEFQKTLTRSNEVFATFKQEMNKMSKTIKKLEKENQSWKSRHDQTSKSMFGMADELRNYKQKIEKLEKLCRALQVERNSLSAKDKSDKELASSPEVPAATPPPTSPLPTEDVSPEKIPLPQDEQEEEVTAED